MTAPVLGEGNALVYLSNGETGYAPRRLDLLIY
jgi:hypothetical protein